MKSSFYFLVLFAFCICLTLSTISTKAQNQRKILVEEGTNTSCGPCAYQNPFFQEWIERNINRVVPVIYHAWWPSKYDPMYTYDTTMQGARIRYYGINKIGVPCGVMAGQYITPTGKWYKGAVGDTLAWTNALNGQSFDSPIKITVVSSYSGGSGTVRVDVESSANLVNKKLRIVICEKYYQFDAPNQETEFFYLARKMLPDFNGIDLTLAIGEMKTFNYDFSLDAAFGNDIYVTAIVQDDVTKDALQAESNLDKLNSKVDNDEGGENLFLNTAYISPNPGANEIELHFNISHNCSGNKINISLVNELGQKVRAVCEDYFESGENEVCIDCSALTSGNYYIVFQQNSRTIVVPFCKD